MNDALSTVDAQRDVDASVDGMSGPDAALLDAGPAPPDHCGEVAEIVLDASGLGTVTGSFAELTHDYSPAASCPEQTPAPDAVYTLQLPKGVHDVVIDTFGSSANTILGVGFTCTAGGLATVCNDDADTVGPSRLWLHRISGPAQLYILVDSLNSSEAGSFQLNVHRTPAWPDACPSAVTGQPLDITGGGTVIGFQQSSVGATRGTCMPKGDFSGEAIFTWTAATSGTAAFVATSYDFSPHVYVRQAGCSAGAEVGCTLGTGDSTILNVNTTAATKYFTFVDGGSGTFSLDYRP